MSDPEEVALHRLIEARIAGPVERLLRQEDETGKRCTAAEIKQVALAALDEDIHEVLNGVVNGFDYQRYLEMKEADRAARGDGPDLFTILLVQSLLPGEPTDGADEP
jgi:hypothetical protein